MPPPPPRPPEYPDPSVPEARAALQAHFERLVGKRAHEGSIPVPENIPLLDDLAEGDELWFPVPGMYGGFALRCLDAHTVEASSWCRIAGGSGERHRLTAEGAVLVEVGFV